MMFYEIASRYSGPLNDFPLNASIDQREVWESLPASLQEALIKKGEEYLHFTYPVNTACDFLEFTRNGNRSRFEEKQFIKRIALNHLILAECIENRGRFMDDIINGIYSICEESAWQLPAHNSYIRDTPQLPLPDVTRPVVDLFAAETGAVLAVAEAILRPALQEISPFISTMIYSHLNHRIFTPYLTEHFWWMGDGKSPMNNWTVWCTQNLLLAAFTQPVPSDIRRQIFEKAAKSTDYFMAEYGDDGCCDEGAQYYRHAGLCLFGVLQLLNGITDNAFASLYEIEKIRNIAAYIYNVHVDDIYYVNFADCSPVAGRCSAREFLFGKAVGHPALTAFAAKDHRKSDDPLLDQEHNLWYHLLQVFTFEEMMNFTSDAASSASHCRQDIFYPSVGLFVARDNTFCLAVKGGDNDDSHNHNDAGSFTIYKNGRPMFIDLGVESYTKKTFSPDRYEIWTMQSQFHNLPAFHGVMEQNGSEFKAEILNYSLNDDLVSIEMELAGAYPSEEIRSYRRAVSFQKQKGQEPAVIEVHDRYDGSLQPTVLSLMTYEKPEIKGDFISIGRLGQVRIDGCSNIEIEILPITDARLQIAWKHDVYRILVTMEKDELTLRIS